MIRVDSASKGKNLVIGLAAQYSYKDLAPFVESLRRTGYEGDVVWFVSEIDNNALQQLERQGVMCIPYRQEHPFFAADTGLPIHIPTELAQKPLSPNSLRYVFYRAFLKLHPNRYRWVLHSDTRDVIFQRDPFAYYDKPGLYCFMEDLACRIKDNKHNSYWIRFGFGEEMAAKMAHEPIVCSGVTLGSVQEFEAYLDKMVQYVVKLPNTGGLDQGIHNYLLFTSQIKGARVVEDDEGMVTTLTTFKPFSKIRFNDKGQLLNNHGEVLGIVHQYDRHLPLLWRYNKLAFFEKVKNLAKRQVLLALGRKFND